MEGIDMDDFKKQLLLSFSSANKVYDAFNVVLYTSAGRISGTIVDDFTSVNDAPSVALGCVVEKTAARLGYPEDIESSFIFLKDVTIVANGITEHSENLLVFLDQISGITWGMK